MDGYVAFLTIYTYTSVYLIDCYGSYDVSFVPSTLPLRGLFPRQNYGTLLALIFAKNCARFVRGYSLLYPHYPPSLSLGLIRLMRAAA